jgi:hypothetical protein
VFIVISYCQFFIFIHSCRPCYFNHPITVTLGCKLLAYHILCIYCKERISLHGQLFCLFQVCGNASFGIPFLFCVCHYTYNFFCFCYWQILKICGTCESSTFMLYLLYWFAGCVYHMILFCYIVLLAYTSKLHTYLSFSFMEREYFDTVCVCVCLYIYVCMCVCVYTHTQDVPLKMQS